MTLEKKCIPSKCPDCGKKVKIIISINGSKMRVDWEQIPLWFSEDNLQHYELRQGYQTHNYTCTARAGYGKSMQRRQR